MIAALALAALGFTASTAHRIDAIVAAEIHAHRTPGIAVGVVESGRLVYARGFGSTRLTAGSRVSPGTQFGIGQISEQFTAAAVLLLAQNHSLSLDDPVTKYVPDALAPRDATIRTLLEQTSGNSYAANPANYLTAARIVEKVAGEPLSDYVQQHIFVPLVMDASLYRGDVERSPVGATGYTRENGRFVPAVPASAARLGGDAGVVTDVYDLAKWDIEFPILLRVNAVREMFTPGVPSAFERHGMGWTLDERGGRQFMWQNGEIPGFHAMNALLPDDHVAVIVLTNSDSLHEPATLPESIAGRILDLVAPPSPRHVGNVVLERAREWIERLRTDRVDRTQLTQEFSTYLSDDVVRRAGIAPLGRVLSLVPISSMAAADGATEYEFLVRFARGERHYHLTIMPDGKIAFISFGP